MTANEYAHYDLRGEARAPAEYERIEVIRSAIPPEVERVLDCGCGDGRVGNAIHGDYRLVGCDIAPASLRRCEFTTVRSSLRDLPFVDDAFDLVISSEVLEHVLPDDFEQSCSEIDRVVTRWILVTVPYRERLEVSRRRCPHCQLILHDAWHLRSIDEAGLCRFFPGFEPRAWFYLGGKLRADQQWLRILRNRLLGYPPLWPHRQCPMCGRFGTDDGRPPSAEVVEGLAYRHPERSDWVTALRGLALRLVPGRSRWLGCLLERRGSSTRDTPLR